MKIKSTFLSVILLLFSFSAGESAETKIYYEIKNKFFSGQFMFSSMEKMLVKLVADYPLNPDFHCLRGIVLSGIDNGKAKTELTKALELKSDHPYALFYLARLEMWSENIEKAISLYRRAIEIEAHEPIFYNSLAALLSAQGSTNEAIEVWERGIANNPNDDSLYFNCAIAISAYRPSEKIKHNLYLEKAEILNPKEFDYHQALGFLYIDQENYDKARVQFEKALEIKPLDAIAQLGLATTYSGKNQYDMAIDLIKKVIERYPDNDLAKQELAECKEAYSKWKAKH